MLRAKEEYPSSVEAIDSLTEDNSLELTEISSGSAPVKSIRSSLRASTIDGVFATIFHNIAGGVLLSNFLVDLNATTVQIGTLAAIPMVVNLIQPLGAYLANRTTSRHQYGLWMFGSSRIIWLILVFGIGLLSWRQADPQLLIYWTLGVISVSHVFAALGSASWLSWLAALVPRQLRGRYFGFRSSASNLTILICVPLAGLGVSAWPGGMIQGYGVTLLLGVLMGLISIGFQFLMQDVNPQVQRSLREPGQASDHCGSESNAQPLRIWQDRNFLIFLVYFGFWAFSLNLSSPFFNIYLLDNLALDVRWVTLYNSLASGSTLLMLVVWGRLSDRVGNRPLLLLVGILVALTPFLWLGIGANPASIWLWLPLLHIFIGSTWAAIELCSNNIQMAIAPIQQHSTYFAIAAAVAGGAGALGTVAGGFLANAGYGGITGIFVVSSVLRLVALLPLLLVHEQPRQSLSQITRVFSAGQPAFNPPPPKTPHETLELEELECPVVVDRHS